MLNIPPAFRRRTDDALEHSCEMSLRPEARKLCGVEQ